MNAAMHAVVVATITLSVIHMVVGLFSVFIGVVSSIQAEVWLAHKVSPIWSGGFFIVTGIMGMVCSRRRSAYMIMCFTAFSIVSLVTAIVSIQLLRLGLVNHTTDGHTFQKEHKDVIILMALGTAGFEILVCIISAIVSCRLAKHAKKELEEKREGAFQVQEESVIEEQHSFPYGDYMPEDYHERRTEALYTTAASQGFVNLATVETDDSCVVSGAQSEVRISVDPPSTSTVSGGEEQPEEILASSIGNVLPDINEPRINRILNILNEASTSGQSSSGGREATSSV